MLFELYTYLTVKDPNVSSNLIIWEKFAYFNHLAKLQSFWQN